MDNLRKIFQSQEELNEKIMPGIMNQISQSQDLRVEWIKKYHLAAQQEMAEAMDSVDWKWWKYSEEKIDYQNLKVELVDVLFFWVSMCLAAGFDAKEMTSAYFQKLKINHERADKGYKTGEYQKVDKDGNEDNRSIK